MKNKKLKADNVEQLLEVVRAIQQGEDPEAAIEAKRAESAQNADSPKPRQKDASTGEDPEGQNVEKQDADDQWDDEFERLLNEEGEKSLSESQMMKRMSSGLGKVKEAFQNKRKQNKEELKAPQPEEKTEVKSKPEISVSGLSSRLQGLLGELQQKGIHRKEMIMIGMGAALAILIIVLVIHAVSVFFAEKRKSEHVTADEGLIVTVEKEPENWCGSYPVELKFRAKSGQITGVTINGEVCEPDENGVVTVITGEYLLEAEARLQDGTLNARIEIPMLDSLPPVVNVNKENDQITVTAADGRSEVAKIWYAEVHSNDYMQLPRYQEYSEPLTFVNDTDYYFYAQDRAGNRSVPIVTTMEAAQELSLSEEKLSLYPQETGYLQIEVQPSGALLNNLKYESANPDVADVDGNGMITAVGEGSTLVNVSADGVDAVSCQIEVSDSRTVTISTIGDCTLGTDEAFNTTTNFNAYYAMNGADYFFRNVRDILRNDDATFANLEGTFTSETTREAKEYAFKGDPSYTEILKEGSVDVVTLANNHSSDYGAQSLEDTKRYLEEAGIDYCTGDTVVLKDVNGIKTAFIGIYVLNDGMARENQVRETIASAKEQGAQLVITAFHWGSERATQPDETQQALAHIAVDCGADLVVGHHPHVLQGIEKYNGKYIVHSLGNFCFGGNSAPSDMDTIIFRQTFTVSRENVVTDDQIEVIPCSVSSTAGYNNYQPTPAQGSEAERIIGRVNEYSQAYGQTYTASSGLE